MMRFQVMMISIAITWAHQSTSSHPTSNSTRLTHSLHRHSYTVTAPRADKKNHGHTHARHTSVSRKKAVFYLIEVSNNHLIELVLLNCTSKNILCSENCSENQFLVHILYVRKISVLLFSVVMEVSES